MVAFFYTKDSIMFKTITSFFKKPTSQQIALAELEEARRQLLRHQSCGEYHAKMAEFYQVNTTRLNKFVNQQHLQSHG